MLKEQGKRGTGPAALAMAIFLVLMTAVTVYLFAAKIWWLPQAITKPGHQIDLQFARTFLVTGIAFVGAQLGLAWVVIRYRDRGRKAVFSRGNTILEIAWTLGILAVFIGLGLYAQNAWARVQFQGAAPGALQIEVDAQQFAWNFRYPGPDGKFGRIKPELANAAEGNPVGLDFTDPAAKDDIVTPQLGVPVGRQVELIIRSQDVTHSFFVRELRIKQDAVPGMETHIHFTANVPGRYDIACAELCGLGHYDMQAELLVMPEAQYRKWLQQQAAYQ